MNKQKAILLAGIIALLLMVILPGVALASSASASVRASKTTAAPGETITFTVNISTSGNLSSVGCRANMGGLSLKSSSASGFSGMGQISDTTFIAISTQGTPVTAGGKITYAATIPPYAQEDSVYTVSFNIEAVDETGTNYALNTTKTVDIAVAGGTSTTPDGYRYISDGNTAIIAGYTGTDSNITLPSTINSYPVTGIGAGAFQNNRAITAVTLPSGLTFIGDRAFDCCSKLTTITIPDSVTSIGEGAFNSCINLSNITIPNNISEINNYTFFGCTSLTSITFPSNITKVGSEAFSNCYTLKYAAFLGYNVAINANAFSSGAPTIYCYPYSDAEFWADEQGYEVVYLDEDDDQPIQQIFLPEDYRAQVGSEFAIEYQVFPHFDNPELKWESSNDAIATVSENGTVRILAEGEVTITCSAINGSIHDSMVITGYLDLESFDLSASECWLISKTTLQLKIQNLKPESIDAKISWTSSNTGVAVVDENGLVTAKRIGSAIITATSESGISRSCTIHSCYPVTAIAFDSTENTLIPGEQMQLTANVTAYTQQFVNKLVSFASSNPDVASVDANGIVTAHAAGASTITATADSGISAKCIIVVSMPNTLNLPASTNQVKSEAFLNCAAEMVILPAGCESIGERGFANCANLAFVYIPESVTSIAEDAFNGCVSLKIICTEGSFSQEYAQRHGITCIIP